MGCPCIACRNRQWLTEWAEGNDKIGPPPLPVIRSEVRRLVEDLRLAQGRA